MKKRYELKNGTVVSLFRKQRGEWATNNDRWYCAIHVYSFGLGVVRTYWGWRILLGFRQICIHTSEGR